MKALALRRWSFALITIALALGLAGAWYLSHIALRPVAMYTGWLLLFLVFGLAFFNARKKLPFFPLFSANTWMQVHIYAGWLSVIIYLLHTGVRWPSGRLESLLALVFFVVSVSGALGVWLSRWLPPRLARSGESLVFERMPLLRHRLLSEVHETVQRAEHETKSTTLGDFYLRYLRDYFARRPGLLLPLTGDDAAHHHVNRELTALRQFLNKREAAFADQFADFVETKRHLDLQLAGQRLLKMWLFVHVPLTYALLVLMTVHVWLVLNFSHRL